MMKKSLACLWTLTFAAVGLQAQKGQAGAHGYFSLSYIHGQKEGGASQGSFKDLGGGLSLTGVFSQNIEYRLEIRSRGESRFALEEAWLGFNLAKALSVRAGLYLVPFGFYNRSNRPHENLLVQTPLAVEPAYPPSWRDLGLLASGQAGFLLYTASLGNGLGEDAEGAPAQQFGDNNASKDVTSRLGIQWKQGLETSVSYSRQVHSSDGDRRADYLGADISWITENYRVVGEYVRVERDEASGGRGKWEGWYVQLALDYRTLWPVVSYQYLKTTPPEEPSSRRNRWTLGLAWSAVSGVLLKAEYAWNREPGAEIKNDLVSAQLAVSF